MYPNLVAIYPCTLHLASSEAISFALLQTFSLKISMPTACRKFALVLWMGDTNPDCWQVI